MRPAEVGYIRVRQGKSACRRECSQDISLDFDDYGNLLGSCGDRERVLRGLS